MKSRGIPIARCVRHAAGANRPRSALATKSITRSKTPRPRERLRDTPDPRYDNAEERRVITGSERTPRARSANRCATITAERTYRVSFSGDEVINEHMLLAVAIAVTGVKSLEIDHVPNNVTYRSAFTPNEVDERARIRVESRDPATVAGIVAAIEQHRRQHR